MKKKLFSNKILSKERLVKFLDKEGFYVVVFLCIAIIATTAVYITRNNMDYFSQNKGNNSEVTEDINDHQYFQPEDLEEQEKKETKEEGQEASAKADEEDKKEEQKSGETTPVVAQNPEKKEDKEQAPAQDNTKGNTTNSQAGASILSKLVRPVEQNTITMDYSYQSKPVFSATLNEFRSDHQGVDIAAEKGTIVKAAMDGKVVDIQNDPRLGMLITIDHGNGIKTKYGNLDSKVEVTKNQQVKRGQTLGKAGNTAMFEIDDEPHIHFEVWNGDKPQDPKNYIKDLKNTTN